MSGFGRGLAFGVLGIGVLGIGVLGISVLGIAAGVAAQATTAARAADPIADFYAGKSLQLVIGYAPGGGYDIYARAARPLYGPPTSRAIPRS